jgi:peroxiredoxin
MEIDMVRRWGVWLAWTAFLLPAFSATVSFDLRDAEGRRHTIAEAHESKAIVLLFLAPDCPISNSYAPELNRLAAQYSRRGVLFYGVFSDPAVSGTEMEQYGREYGYSFPLLLDRSQSLARQAGAAATPEAVILSARGEVLYRGRIDDRFIDFGKTRPAPACRDVKLSLDQILAGKPVSHPATKALGCGIPFGREIHGEAVTFARDIAPIVYQHCAPCHHPGGAAPFPLLRYEDVTKRASQIAAVTSSGYMPPWKPQPGYGKFRGERGLTEAEVTAIRDWVNEGAPLGKTATPPAPKFASGWQLGTPDLIAKMPEPFTVPAEGPDIYQCFVIPITLPADRYVRAVEFQPENRSAVHHALFFADLSGGARRRDAEDPAAGYRCFGVPGFLPSAALGGWSPGVAPLETPAQTAVPLKKGSDLVLQIHFHPTGKQEREQASLGLYFTSVPPQRRVADVALGSRNIDIPPGDRSYKVRDGFTLPIDVEAVGIIPHAHYICKDMKGWALLPDGTKKWLIWIKDWDFNWQEQYQYGPSLHLPAGTRLEMEFTYDNSNQNPRNPNHPPKRVLWGPESTDEMAGLHLQVIPERMSEMPILGQALWGKIMRSMGGKFFTLPSQ